MNIVPPDLRLKSFTCPHCGVLARQTKWGYLGRFASETCLGENQLSKGEISVSKCDSCEKNCLWMESVYVYPAVSPVARANVDMPAEIQADYNEAAAIIATSPRGAAALLRLAIQKLMVHLGQPGKSINDDIASLVAAGLPKQIQQALDVVRVTGNNAVHPGKLDASDVEIAQQLFPLVNVIVEYQISLPGRVQKMYEALPASALAGIAKRDSA